MVKYLVIPKKNQNIYILEITTLLNSDVNLGQPKKHCFYIISKD